MSSHIVTGESTLCTLLSTEISLALVHKALTLLCLMVLRRGSCWLCAPWLHIFTVVHPSLLCRWERGYHSLHTAQRSPPPTPALGLSAFLLSSASASCHAPQSSILCHFLFFLPSYLWSSHLTSLDFFFRFCLLFFPFFLEKIKQF